MCFLDVWNWKISFFLDVVFDTGRLILAEYPFFSLKAESLTQTRAASNWMHWSLEVCFSLFISCRKSTVHLSSHTSCRYITATQFLLSFCFLLIPSWRSLRSSAMCHIQPISFGLRAHIFAWLLITVMDLEPDGRKRGVFHSKWKHSGPHLSVILLSVADPFYFYINNIFF